MSRKDPSMTAERWNYLKNLGRAQPKVRPQAQSQGDKRPSEGRLVHLSKPLVAVPITVPTGEIGEDGEEIRKQIGERLIVSPYKGKTFRRKKDPDEVLAKMLGLSKRQTRKYRKSVKRAMKESTRD